MSIESQYKEIFEKGDHLKAVEFLKENVESFDPALYHYNLGVNYVRLEKLPLARFHLEKAKDNGLYSPELRESLSRVRDLLGAETMEVKSGFMDHIYGSALDASIYTGINVTLVLLIIGLTQFKKIKRWWLRLILVALALAPGAGQFYLKSSYEQVIAMKAKPVLMGPSKIFEQAQELVPGMKVSISKDMNGWRYVLSPSSHRGWVRSGDLKSL